MSTRNVFLLLGKWGLLTILYTVCFILGTLFSGLSQADPSADNPADNSGIIMLLVTSVISVALLAWPVLRTDWSRWKTMLALFLMLFSLVSILPQLDSLFFNSPLGLSKQEVGTIIFSGFITALLYIPLSVWMLYSPKEARPVDQLKAPFPYWKILGLSIIYLMVYFLFGYFVAWQSPDLREFYSGSTSIQPFWPHVKQTWQDSPSLFSLQIFRGLIWASLAYLIGRMMKGPNWEKVTVIALLFGLLGSLLLLLPNPYMPDEIREVHLLEVVSSNLFYGFIAGWLLFFRPKVITG